MSDPSVVHVSVDIETLSVAPNAMMLAIGACEIKFKLNDIGHKFYQLIDHNSYKGLDYDIDPDAVMWWMEQSDAARRGLYVDTGSRKPIHAVLEELGCWMSDLMLIGNGADKICVWGNGENFDNVVLTHFFKQCDITMPWSFRDDRCFRTMSKSFPDVANPPNEPIAHHALHDAIWQAKKLILINNAKNLGFEDGDI